MSDINNVAAKVDLNTKATGFKKEISDTSNLIEAHEFDRKTTIYFLMAEW